MSGPAEISNSKRSRLTLIDEFSNCLRRSYLGNSPPAIQGVEQPQAASRSCPKTAQAATFILATNVNTILDAARKRPEIGR